MEYFALTQEKDAAPELTSTSYSRVFTERALQL